MHVEMYKLCTMIVSSICNCNPVHAWFGSTLCQCEHSLSAINKFAYNYKSLLLKIIFFVTKHYFCVVTCRQIRFCSVMPIAKKRHVYNYLYLKFCV